ncbi:T9SS type A sorting domain-containing protein [Aquimarina sp. AU474]|uniref:T9SS type A sorting domain-containing protein n=1 Tax=Aquimarina sp. AU474 TaxID=2108529 RepID=UPI000D68E811|nr:T9SS type A sorting domain-containing protein [Aquimarina sp. AU474]
MKRLLLLLIIVLSFYTTDVAAQDQYTIRYELSYNDTGRHYRCLSYYVKVKYVGQSDFETVGEGPWWEGRRTLRGSITVPANKRIAEWQVQAVRHIRRGCGSGSRRRRTQTITGVSHSFCRTYSYDMSFLGAAMGGANIKIFTEPLLKIKFSDNSSVNRTKTACESEGIGIQDPSVFPAWNSIYRWEFEERSRRVETEAFKRARRQAQDAYNEYQLCLDGGGTPLVIAGADPNPLAGIGAPSPAPLAPPDGACEFYYFAWQLAQQEVQDLINSGQQYRNEPVYKELTKYRGDKSINLKLTDMFTYNSAAYRQKINKPIRVRLNPDCSPEDKVSNVITVLYLPEAPEIARVPEVTQPKCFGGNDATLKLFFKRQIYSAEEMYFNLFKKFQDGTYQTVDNNTGIRSFVQEGSNWTYTWAPSPGKGLEAGEYRLAVTGYDRSIGEGAPFCEEYEYPFTITPPDAIVFDATKKSDETCFEKNDGSIEITASNGTGPYTYSLDNGATWSTTSFTAAQSPILVSGVSVGVKNVKIQDNNGCITPTAVMVEILRKDQIDHNIVEVATGSDPNPLHPGAPGASDAKITIDEVTGGNPIVDGSSQYYDYEVWWDGNSMTVKETGRAFTNGFDIIGLRKGNHKIKYTDDKGCFIVLDLPEIIDPEAITFKVEEVAPSCAGGNDGTIRVYDIAGGYAPYSISWKKGASDYGTGLSITGEDAVYAVTVTDARSGSESETDIRFTNIPLPIRITDIDDQPITCFGDNAAVTLTVEGGKSGIYQYAVWNGPTTTTWQDSNVFALAARTAPYRFVARDRDVTTCRSDIAGNLTISQPIEIGITPTSVVDNDIFGDNKGAIQISVSGGTPGPSGSEYTVTWSRNGTAISDVGTNISNLLAGDYVATVTDGTGTCSKPSNIIVVDEPDELLVSIKIDMAIPCDGGVGTLLAEPIGGSETYTYTWYREGTLITGENNQSITNIQTGNYRVRVNDGFTFKEDNLLFEDPDPLTLSLGKTDVACFGENTGEIVLTPGGGTRPYYFSIDNKATYVSEDDLTSFTIEGLVQGTYEVWIKDANDCELDTSKSITIIESEEIEITRVSFEHATSIGGTDGNILIDVVGGTGSHTLTWTKDGDISFSRNTLFIDNLSQGSYTITVKDERDCEVNETFVVLQPLPITVEIEGVTPILCHDDALGEIKAVVSGGFPIESVPADFDYQWYLVEGAIETPLNTDLTLDQISDLEAGLYKIVATDSKGEEAEDTFNLTQPDDLVVTLDGDPINVNCHGESTGVINITVVGGPKDETTGAYLPYSFNWTKLEDIDFEETTEDLAGLSSGTYEVVVIDDNLCTTSLPASVVITQPDAPLEITGVTPVNLTGYETNNGEITLDVTGGTTPYTYEWVDLDDPSFSASTEDLEDVPIGNYRLVVTDDNDCIATITERLTQPDELIVEIQSITLEEGIQCFGEETQIPLITTTVGGFGSYTYQWYEQDDPTTILFTTPNTDTTLPYGVYTVVVTDENGNTDDHTYTVQQPDLLEINEVTTHLLCNGDSDGAIDITVTGGVEPYSYSWSNGDLIEDVSSLRAGFYTITVTDANDCIVEKEIQVRQPQSLFVIGGTIDREYPSSAGATDGSIRVNIGGGTEPYTFEWFDFNGVPQSSTTNVLSNVGAEKYSLTVTDANMCVLQIDDVDLFEPPVLEVRIEPISVISCFGSATSGSLTAVVQGGVPFNSTKQYNYQWYNADLNTPIGIDGFLLQGIPAGNYYIIVSDAVSTSTTSDVFELSEPDALDLQISSDFVNCGDQNDWTITTSVMGGTAPYRYFWSTGASTDRLENVIAGTYTLDIIDARGCTTSGTVVLTAPLALTSDHIVTDPTCYAGCDGKILLETSGGTPPYSYQWSNGSTSEDLVSICANTYQVTITDAKGCQISKEILVDSPEEFIVDIGEDITLCQDQVAEINATVTDPTATYLWSSDNGFTSTDPVVEVDAIGIYTVEVTDGKGCIATDDIFIDRTTDIVAAQFIASTQVFVNEQFVIVNISNPIPDSLDWTFPEEAKVVFADDNYAELVFDTPGEYEITVTTFRGLCSATQTKKVIVVEKEFDENEEENEEDESITSSIEYKVYPNPSNGIFKVDVSLAKPSPINVKIFNMVNNNLIDSRSDQGKDSYMFDYDMSSLNSGIYFILLETRSGSQVRKLIME